LHEVVVVLPPTKAEQEAVAEALSNADALIESLEQLIAKKRQIKQGAMQELLTGKKRLPGFATKPGFKQTEVGVIPEDWEVIRVRDLVKHGPKNGYSGRSGQDSRGTPTLNLAATSSGRLLLNQDTVKYLENRVPADSPLLLEPGDILVQRSNTAELVGTTAIFNGPAATFVYPDLIMRLRFKKRATAEWFWRYANSTSGRRFFSRVAAGSTGSMPKISGDTLRDMVVPLPPMAEQEAITTILNDMDAEITALEEKLAKARQLKQGMMQELLTGKTRLVNSGNLKMESEK
jgi:type I restriction enzyme, S subunit